VNCFTTINVGKYYNVAIIINNNTTKIDFKKKLIIEELKMDDSLIFYCFETLNLILKDCFSSLIPIQHIHIFKQNSS
jgi:hypothetical protein